MHACAHIYKTCIGSVAGDADEREEREREREREFSRAERIGAASSRAGAHRDGGRTYKRASER